MSDDKMPGNKSGRPNAAYRLSEKTQPDGEMVFRYSREERLAKAPAAVRDLYDEKKKPKFSLLGPLIGGKGRAAMFGSIMIICAAMVLLMIFDPAGSYELEGNRVDIQALKYDGAIIVVLQKTARKNTAPAYTGQVDIGASPALSTAGATEAPPAFLHRVFFTAEPSEEYRFSVPFESESVLLVLQTETENLNVKVKVR